ncbi:MAG TPA: hypothetical protein VK427_05960 [Kofleriaceae bacterium]|nr:hypothetical protein [Kofleriaceae bacterium]
MTPQDAIYVTARLAPSALRKVPLARAAIDRAIHVALARDDFRIIHAALRLERTRVELIVEARDERALARGMQAFQISAARSLNRLARRRGPGVFPDRYSARIITTRRALAAAIESLPSEARGRIVTPQSPLFGA